MASPSAPRQDDEAVRLGAASSTARATATITWRDVGVAIAVLVASFVLYLPSGGAPDPQVAQLLLSAVLVVGQSAPLVWRRRRPELVTLAVLAAALVHAVLLGPVPPFATWVALYASALHVTPVRRALTTTAVALVGAVVALVAGPAVHGRGGDGLLLALVLTVVAVLLAALVRTERARLEALRQRAASLERERDAASRQAAVEERLRIARDLHDLVGHGLTSMAVQSSTARVLLDSGDVDGASHRMRELERASRSAMAEMRQLLDVLRGEQQPDLAPSPGLQDLARLVDAARDNGLEVSLTVEGATDRVPPSAALAAFRIVQESLTNVLKHASDASADVRVRAVDGQLHLEVCDDGRPVRAPVGEGHGLVGMRERAALLGGTLTAGAADDDGGWRVAAVLPARERT